jgi:hypothetical protein
MSKISKEAKKEEAVKRLEELTKTFNLRPNILKYFKEDKLYYSYITCKGLLKSLTDLKKNMIVLFITSLKPATL